jgi:hypothetical protein
MWNDRIAELGRRSGEPDLDDVMEAALTTPVSWFDDIEAATQWVFVWLDQPIVGHLRGPFDDGVRAGYRAVGLLLGDEARPTIHSSPSDVDIAAAQLFIASRDAYGEILGLLPPVLRELRDRVVLQLVDRWRGFRPGDVVTELCGACQAGVQSGLVVGLTERDWLASDAGE